MHHYVLRPQPRQRRQTDRWMHSQRLELIDNRDRQRLVIDFLIEDAAHYDRQRDCFAIQ